MPRIYQAFISYRHADVDSRVAREVQHSLEHFHVPLNLRKQTGFKNLHPVFRDKEELPVTSELAQDLTEALQNSRRLIVICSPRTAESMWVQREIETFLKTHKQSDVLTVLAEGEPSEVIPPLLLNQRREIVLEDGSKQEVAVPVEPLSCDFRSPRKRTHRSEVTRLAAAILGVPYDALARRQQRYRRRIAAAAATVAGCALAYTTWSLVTIRGNYREIQINQSTTLARTALERFDQGDRLTAVELAVEALPREGYERPLVAEAELALQKVSNAYVPPSGMEYRLPALRSDYGAIRSIDTGHNVDRMVASPDGTSVATLSAAGDVSCWRIEDGTRLCSVHTNRDARGVVFVDDKHIAVLVGGGIGCISLENGKVVWDAFIKGSESLRPWDAMEEDTGGLLLEEFAYEIPLWVGMDADSGMLTVLSTHTLYLLDATTGERRNAISLDELGEQELSYSSDAYGYAHNDVSNGIFAASSMTNLDETNPLTLVDTDTGTACLSDESFAQINAVKVLSGGNVLVSASTLDGPSSISRESHLDSFSYSWTVPYTQRLTCLDGKTGATVWSQDLALNYERRRVSILEAQISEEDGTLHDCVIWCGANTCAWFDKQTGRPLGKNTVPAAFISAWLGPAAEDGGISTVEGCLDDGQYASCLLDSGESMSTSCFLSSAGDAASTSMGVLISAGTNVMQYGSGCCDDTWESFEPALSGASDCVVTSRGLCVPDDTGTLHEGIPTVELYDSKTHKQLWSTKLCEKDELSPGYVGLTSDGTRLVFYRDIEPASITLVSLEDGSVENWNVEETAIDTRSNGDTRCNIRIYAGSSTLVGSDTLVVPSFSILPGLSTQKEIEYGLVTIDLATHEQIFWALPIESISFRFVPDEHSGRLLLGTYSSSADSVLYDAAIFDSASGSLVLLETPVTNSLYPLGDLDALWGADGAVYAKGANQIVCYEPTGAERFSVDVSKHTVLGMHLSDKALELCVSGTRENQASILRYDKRTGKLLSSYEFDAGLEGYSVTQLREGGINIYWTDVHDASSTRQRNELTVLRFKDTALVLDDTGGVHQMVRNCEGYDPDSDSFLVYDDQGKLGAVERYDLDELVQRGQEMLDSSLASEEQQTE